VIVSVFVVGEERVLDCFFILLLLLRIGDLFVLSY